MLGHLRVRSILKKTIDCRVLSATFSQSSGLRRSDGLDEWGWDEDIKWDEDFNEDFDLDDLDGYLESALEQREQSVPATTDNRDDILGLVSNIASRSHKLGKKGKDNDPNPFPRDVDEEDLVIKEEIRRYHRGKRWLANIMGMDPETFAQTDIKRALKYLLPSHLWAKDARPSMKHPYNTFSLTSKNFDKNGRPLHPAFYTHREGFHDTNFKLWDTLDRLNKLEDRYPPSALRALREKSKIEKIKAADRKWPEKRASKKTEELNRAEDWDVKVRMTRIINHNMVLHDKKASQLVGRYIGMEQQSRENTKLKVEMDKKEGTVRAMGIRKSARADVKVRDNGSGRITINNQPVLKYFTLHNGLEQVMHPLLVLDMLDRFDIDAQVIDGGLHGQAGAVRHGMSRAISQLVPECYGPLREAGLLHVDNRKKEPLKSGQLGARKGRTWKAR